MTLTIDLNPRMIAHFLTRKGTNFEENLYR